MGCNRVCQGFVKSAARVSGVTFGTIIASTQARVVGIYQELTNLTSRSSARVRIADQKITRLDELLSWRYAASAA